MLIRMPDTPHGAGPGAMVRSGSLSRVRQALAARAAATEMTRDAALAAIRSGCTCYQALTRDVGKTATLPSPARHVGHQHAREQQLPSVTKRRH
jgi:hypothetical protein